MQPELSVNESAPFGKLRRMKTTGERIRYLRKDVLGLNQTAFANTLQGVTRGAVGNWELGGGAKRENLLQIAERHGVSFEWLALGRGAPPEPGMGSSAPLLPPPPRPAPSGNASTPEPRPIAPRTMIPVWGLAVGGNDGRFILNGQKVAEVFAPAELEHVPDAYAVYVFGTSMEPRYAEGEGVWVHPHRPVRAGNYVVVHIKGDSGEPDLGYVKKFVRRSAKELVVEQLNPPKGEDRLMRFPGDRVVAVHRIIGSFET
jgi:phage repressor protein C with HTH and peptisase S24 domain